MSDGLGLALATSLPFSLVQSSFSPLDVAGIAGWWDASDTTTLTEIGDAVSQWDDKSGLLNHLLQATALQQPLTNQDPQNSLNGVKFDGSNDRMVRLGMNKDIQEWFMVVKVNAGSASPDGLLSNNGDRGNIRVANSAGQFRYDNDLVIPGAPGDPNDLGAKDGQWNPDGITGSVLADLTLSVGTAHRLHCTRGSTINNDANVYDDLSVGGDPVAGGRWLPMTLYELIGYDAVLSASDRTDLRDYLKVKWGVA